ncbi:hypothetical protein Dsin_016084 [Dipteronia sinensis]|uniref:Uncharacterized protein n=1 Tax=Dipteronia sinensis TaxID=43782 RepID=A0AAE0ADC5_9ROSI|nr:hypothetical protein Dsin_016084 [Dipteronia sinensis]
MSSPGAGAALMEHSLMMDIHLAVNWVMETMLTTYNLTWSTLERMLKHWKYHVDSITQVQYLNMSNICCLWFWLHKDYLVHPCTIMWLVQKFPSALLIRSLIWSHINCMHLLSNMQQQYIFPELLYLRGKYTEVRDNCSGGASLLSCSQISHVVNLDFTLFMVNLVQAVDATIGLHCPTDMIHLFFLNK